MYLSASSTIYNLPANFQLVSVGISARSPSLNWGSSSLAPSFSAVSLYFDYAGPDRVPVGNDVVNGGFCRSSDLRPSLRQ
jgi:hypothetical protein